MESTVRPLKPDTFVLVGAGAGGAALLTALLEIPGVLVRTVVDIDDRAPGMDLARSRGLETWTGDCPESVAAAPGVDVLLEVTGRREVFERLSRMKRSETVLIPASVTKVLFHLLESQAKTNHELQEMTNRLEQRVVERTEELARLNSALQKEIFESQRINAELTRVNEEKTRYLVQATHQLKAPFAAIQSYIDILLDGFAGEIGQRVIEVLRKIRRRAEHLTAAIAEMLELEHIKSCRWETLPREPLDLEELLRRVVRHFEEQARKRNIQISLEFCAETIRVEGNREQVSEMFDNLLENAVHYSRDGSSIVVRTSLLPDGRVGVAVIDSGIGIPRENLGKIFREYFRSNNAAEVYENGSGLGLAIVKQVAEMHHFEIVVESELGRGTTFFIKAPSAPAG